jgi:hypothetical protein
MKRAISEGETYAACHLAAIWLVAEKGSRGADSNHRHADFPTTNPK